MHEFIKNAFFFKKNHEIFAYFIFILYFCSRIMKGAPMRVPFSHIFRSFFVNLKNENNLLRLIFFFFYDR